MKDRRAAKRDCKIVDYFYPTRKYPSLANSPEMKSTASSEPPIPFPPALTEEGPHLQYEHQHSVVVED